MNIEAILSGGAPSVNGLIYVCICIFIDYGSRHKRIMQYTNNNRQTINGTFLVVKITNY